VASNPIVDAIALHISTCFGFRLRAAQCTDQLHLAGLTKVGLYKLPHFKQHSKDGVAQNQTHLHYSPNQYLQLKTIARYEATKAREIHSDINDLMSKVGAKTTGLVKSESGIDSSHHLRKSKRFLD
jgi:hypothetical protein